MVNFNPTYISAEYLGMTRNALKTTMYGNANLIETVVEEGRVKFRVNSTGKVYESAADAFQKAGESGITQWSKIEGINNQRGLQGFGERLASAKDVLSKDADLRASFGIADVNDLFFTVGTQKTPMGKKQLSKNILEGYKDKGFVFGDGDSSTYIRAFIKGQEDTELTTMEISRLLYTTNAPTGNSLGGFISSTDISEALQKGSLTKLFEKTGKRIKGAISLKPSTMTGSTLNDILGGKSLAESTLVVDYESDLSNLMSKYVDSYNGLSEGIKLNNRSLATEIVEKTFGADQEKLALYGDSPSFTGARSTMERLGVISSPDSGQIKIHKQEVMDAIRTKNPDSLNPNDKALYDEIMESFKRPSDGSLLINVNKKNEYIAQLKNEKNTIKLKGALTEEDFTRLKIIESDISNLQDGIHANTITAFYNQDGKAFEIKGVVNEASFKDSLDRYTLITSKANVKTEASIMGRTDSINIVLQGSAKDGVYLDPLAPAFHGEIFSNPETLQANRLRAERILQSYEESINTNVFNKELRIQIFADAEKDLAAVPSEFRATAERSKFFAEELKRSLMAGTDIRSNPQMSNYLMNYVQSQLVRPKDGLVQPIMEDTYRFGINTDVAYYNGRRAKTALGGGALPLETTYMENVSKFNLSADSTTATGLLNFKVRDGQVITSADASNIFHFSFGTYDHDDDVVSSMRVLKTYNKETNSINERLSFFTFRQPTGPNEYAIANAELRDTETLRATYGKNTALVEELGNVAKSEHGNATQKLLHEIISAEKLSESQINLYNNRLMGHSDQEVHDALISGMRSAEAKGIYQSQTITSDILKQLRGKEYATTLSMDSKSLKTLIDAGLSDGYLVPQYNQGNLFTLFPNKKGAYNLEEETIARITESNLLTSTQKQNLLKPELESENLLQRIGKIYDSPETSGQLKQFLHSSLETEYMLKSRKTAEMADSIGMYMNRLTVSSAPTRQAEDILERLEQKQPGITAEIMGKHRVGLISPSEAVDLTVNLTTQQGLDSDQIIKHYKASNAGYTESDISGISSYLQRIEDKRLAALAAGQPAKLLDIIGQESTETAARMMAEINANVYRYGMQGDPDNLLGIDFMIARQRLKGEDAVRFADEYINHFTKQFGDDFTKAPQEAIDFAENWQKTVKGTSENIAIGIRSILGKKEGKYAGAYLQGQLGAQAEARAKSIGRMARTDIVIPFQSEMRYSSEANDAAQNIVELYKALKDKHGSALLDASDFEGNLEEVQFAIYQKGMRLREIGGSVHEAVMTVAKEKNIEVRDVLSHIERIEATDRNARGITSLKTSTGETENELINLFQAGRDERARAIYNRQEGLSELVRQHDEFAALPNADVQTQVYDTINGYRTMQGLEPEIDPIKEAYKVSRTGGKTAVEELNLSSDMTDTVRRIHLASENAKAFTPEMEAALSMKGSAINFAPSALNEAERAVALGEKGGETLVKSGAYKRIGESALLKNPIARKTAFAAVALFGASLVYSKHKERGEAEIAGPPLLPGGSSYEQMPLRSPQMPQTSMFSGYNTGTSYNIHMSGSHEQVNSFRSAAGSVAQGPVNSTMYKGSPRMGKDPYSHIAGSF